MRSVVFAGIGRALVSICIKNDCICCYIPDSSVVAVLVLSVEKFPIELIARPALTPKIAIHCILDKVRPINKNVSMAHQITTLL